jgi:hypothetical protein
LTRTKNQANKHLEEKDTNLVEPNTNLNFEVLCTICAEVIEDYCPKFFHGYKINAACNECQGSSIDQESEAEVCSR